ncbi:beta-glucoside operon transcriptional antiterminator [Arcanobacterium pluranimalium]|uniref:PRD domain-containing protein n=1 Tax=Arcanobacterium pluranimalium TaxID=108028 RepID=UPI00195E6A77|nr:PRD domain-containing protein [Arcanobacterium pluranimalium]MBM7824916.1 beta-glucoside operon transcriptional antiterminator [Arcanobacterium pluranimalium]
MDVLRVFNNNVVLARDDDAAEVIVTGWGIGFQAKPGSSIDPSKVVRKFVPVDGRDPDHLGKLLADIPPKILELLEKAFSSTDSGLGSNPAFVLALADHITFAFERVRTAMDVRYPLEAEVRNLYPQEYAQAVDLLTQINRLSEEQLPQDEAVAIALHLVNLGFSHGDLSYTYMMTGIIQQMIEVIETSFGVHLESTSVNVGRFITHLRYLFVRIHQQKQINEEEISVIGQAIRDSYPECVAVAQKLAAIIELRFDTRVSEDEISYLTMHIARVSGDAQPIRKESQ